MSRSNPTTNEPNPATRWYAWDGANGNVRYYDKEAVDPKTQENGMTVAVRDGFTFILLDETSTIKGWNDADKCGIGSNEVRDTRNETMTVRLFNERRTVIASGAYQQIRERVLASGGHFTSTCYIAGKEPSGALAISALQIKGAALSEWMEFKRKNRKAVYEQAVQIKGFKEGKKGAIKYRVPVFHLKPLSTETNAAAMELDKQLQEYLTGYFARAAKQAPQTARDEQPQDDGPTDQEPTPGVHNPDYEPPPEMAPVDDEPTDDDNPF